MRQVVSTLTLCGGWQAPRTTMVASCCVSSIVVSSRDEKVASQLQLGDHTELAHHSQVIIVAPVFHDLLLFNLHWILKEKEHKEMNNIMLFRGTVVTVRAFGSKLFATPSMGMFLFMKMGPFLGSPSH
jgi:hypothetical protein